VELILADTSVWIDHIRSANPSLAGLIGQRRLLTHPLVVGELVLGNLPDWERTLAWLRSLPAARPVADQQVYDLIRTRKLQGSGLGVIDAHLLAVTAERADVRLWTRDKRLAKAVEAIGRQWEP
jgi:predicted nucleic acid-binding protein